MIIPPLFIGFVIVPHYFNKNATKNKVNTLDIAVTIVVCIVLMMSSVIGGINSYIAYHSLGYRNTSRASVEIQYDEIEAYHYAE